MDMSKNCRLTLDDGMYVSEDVFVS